MTILYSIAVIYGLDFELLRIGNLGRSHENRSWALVSAVIHALLLHGIEHTNRTAVVQSF